MPDDVRACVEERLGAAEGQYPSSEVLEATRGCQQELVFGPDFAATLRSDHPGLYSDQQLACISGAFAALSNEDLDVILEAALDPQRQDDSAYRDVLEDLFGSCDAPIAEPSE